MAQLKLNIYRVPGLEMGYVIGYYGKISIRKFLQALRLSVEKLFRKWIFFLISL